MCPNQHLERRRTYGTAVCRKRQGPCVGPMKSFVLKSAIIYWLRTVVYEGSLKVKKIVLYDMAYYQPQQNTGGGGGGGNMGGGGIQGSNFGIPQQGIIGSGGGGGIGGGGDQGAMNFLKSENADMLMNYGLSQGQTLLKTQSDKWMPGVTGFWSSLKIYFAVNNSYVVKKLSMILYPIGVKKNQNWLRKSAEEPGFDQTSDIRSKWALPKDDTCAPDLYIPLMSFITYVLLYGLYTGMGGADFSPEVLITAIWRCFIVQLCEVAVTMLGLSFINGSIPFLDVFAYTGYKYVGLCVSIIARVFGSMVATIVGLYTSAMLAFFFIKCMASLVAPSDAAPSRHYVLLGLACIQFFVAASLGWF